QAHYLLAVRYSQDRRHDDASRALQRALAIDPRYTPAMVGLAFQAFRRRPELAREMRENKVPREWLDSLDAGRRLLHRAFLVDPLAELEPPDMPQQDARSARF